ncbi:MAG TPA: hypothetical protein VIL74_08905 [Pyrinomonadaceae bacterium]|jgi:hypothetical protein
MNKKLEMIVTQRDVAIKNLEDFKHNRQIFISAGFNDAQIESMEKEHRASFELANNLFWEAIKYTPEIFDLENGDIPNDGETVYVYDEYDHEWMKAEITAQCYDGALRFVQGMHILGSPNSYERYTRWTRLPVLNSED